MREFIANLSQSLQIFSALDVGAILYARTPDKYKDLHSARVQAQKALNNEVELNHLEKCKGFYRVPGCKSEHGEHSRLLTQYLVEILKVTDATIYREHIVSEIGLRPDALVLITHGDRGLCVILEVVHNETQEYLKQKVSAWNGWTGSNQYLSQLFGCLIQGFSIVTAGVSFPDCVTFDDFLAEVKGHGER